MTPEQVKAFYEMQGFEVTLSEMPDGTTAVWGWKGELVVKPEDIARMRLRGPILRLGV